jgi:VWFA-related protein
MSLRRTRPALAALAALLLAVGGAVAEAPLTTADLVRFLKVGISERTILTELQGRGFGESLDAAREVELREAGASETLVVAVRRFSPAGRAAEAAPARPAPTPAASPGAAPRLELPSFAARTRTVRVPVSVLDDAGRPVLGLRSSDFQVKDDGKRQPITLFSGERRALRIALALDTSGSMSNKMREVEQALRHFIDLLEPADEILVLTFNDRVHLVQDFTSDRALLGRGLDMLTPVGPTALYDAAAEAIRRVAPGSAESKAIVIVSDGVDTASRSSFESLRELARRSEVPVFSIGLDADERSVVRLPGRSGPIGGGPRFPGVGGGRGRWPGRGPGGGGGGWPGGGGGGWPGGGSGGGGQTMRLDGFDAGPLRDLADDTGARAEIVKGGTHYKPGEDWPGSDRLKAAVESIALTLRHRYLLGYEPPDGKAGWHTIRVEVDRSSAQARARKGYYAGA